LRQGSGDGYAFTPNLAEDEAPGKMPKKEAGGQHSLLRKKVKWGILQRFLGGGPETEDGRG